MRSNSKHRAILTSLLALGGVLALGGCDKDESEEQNASASEESKPADAEDAQEAEAGNKGSAEAKDAKIAALEAELAAAKEAAAAAKAVDPEAAAKLGEGVTPEAEVAPEQQLAEGEKGPVSVANVTFDKQERPFGGSEPRYELAADVTVNEVKEGGVYVKAACAVGEEVFVDVRTVSSKHSDLGEMKQGETKRLDTRLFGSGLPGVPTRCALAFDYGASSFSTRVADACWDGKSVTEGACKEPVKARTEGAGKIVPFAFVVEPDKALLSDEPDAIALEVSYGARFNEHIEQAPHLHTKTACKVGEQVWVEVSPDFPHVKPFSLENGEAVMMHHNQFFMNALPGTPEACNIEVLLDGDRGTADQKLAEVCAKAGVVLPLRCGFRTDPEQPPAPMDGDSITIDQLAVKWTPDWSDKSKVVLQTRLAATVRKGISDRVQMTGVVECGGKKDEDHHIGPDLQYIGPGETVGINFASFRGEPLDKPSGRCEVTFGAKPFLSREEGVQIAKFCLKGNKLVAGKCKGKGKPAKVDELVAFTPKGSKKK